MINKDCIPFVGGVYDGKLLTLADLKNDAKIDLTVTVGDTSTKYFRYPFIIGLSTFIVYAQMGTRVEDIMLAIFKGYGKNTGAASPKK